MGQLFSAGAKPEPGRISSLDGWRGIAILLVVSEHLQVGMLGRLPLQTGLHGVTLFFVLSGYLITRKLLTEERKTGTIHLRAFYRRRFRRLMPAAWAYLIVLFTVMLIGRVRFHAVDFISALLFFRNYVDPRGLTGHFWSLSIEEQFYLIWPLLLMRLSRRTAVAGTLAGACLLAVWRFSGHSGLFPHAGWQALHTEFQADALLTGCAAALAGPWLQRYLRTWMAWPLGATLLLLIAFDPLPVSLFESAIIAVLLLITSEWPGTFLDLRPLRTIGLLSYSLYMWQQPFLMARFSSPLNMCVRIGLLIGCATMSWWFLEPHSRRQGIQDLILTRDPARVPAL